MDSQLWLVLIGGILGVSGAVVGAVLTRIVQFWLDGIREKRLRREEAMHKALEWAEGGRKGTLRHLDLQGAHLGGVDLGPGEGRKEGADLSYAELAQADLRGARLERANLTGANLRGANLVGASLAGADLRDATLAKAQLWGANLQGTLLWRANLEEGGLQETKLGMAELPGANLRGADLTGADLQGANLWRANLKGANLQGTKLIGANLGKLEWDGQTKWPAGCAPPAESPK